MTPFDVGFGIIGGLILGGVALAIVGWHIYKDIVG